MTQRFHTLLPIFINYFTQFTNLEAVKCHRYVLHSQDDSCEGDFCVIQRKAFSANYQTCITGPKIPSTTCFLDFEDSVQCFCDTDFCNNSTLLLSNATILPIIECKDVIAKQYRAAACNKCIWSLEYLKQDKSLAPSDRTDRVICSQTDESGPFNLQFTKYMETRLATNFYTEACYNVSLHSFHYSTYCKCTTKNCNDPEAPIPYPISSPTVSCYTSGYDAKVDNAKYETDGDFYENIYRDLMQNESYYDEGIQCRGHYCFIAVDKIHEKPLHFKGCISANEQGDNKIQLGYSFINEIPYFICNTDFCNYDIATATDEARNATAVQDNSSNLSKNIIIFVFIISVEFLFETIN